MLHCLALGRVHYLLDLERLRLPDETIFAFEVTGYHSILKPVCWLHYSLLLGSIATVLVRDYYRQQV